MELIVLHNPEAGGAGSNAHEIDRLLREAGHNPRIESSKFKWPQVMREPAEAYVAAGGDGTVHKVLRAVQGRNVPVAILPLGTANNVAHSFGYNTGDDLRRRVAGWREHERILQLGMVEQAGDHDLFVEVVGVGAFANMVRRENSGETKSPALLALTAIRQHLAREVQKAEPMQMSSTIDGTRVEGEYVLLECLNVPTYGPRLEFAPNESPSVGAVTVCGVTVAQREAAARWISTGEGNAGEFVLGRGALIEITTAAEAHVDGDPWPDEEPDDAPLTIQAGVRSVRIWV
jgi:diacylglycerol kinase (ATP)